MTTMHAYSEADVQKFIDQKVLLTISGKEEMEGVLAAYNDKAGGFFKKKGSPNGYIFRPEELTKIEFAPEKTKPIVSKTVPHLTYGKARQHLADRHGVERSTLKDLSEADALEWHDNDIAHGDLGHYHSAQSKKDEIDEAAESETVAPASVEIEGQEPIPF